jgi:hypothetical protein
MNDINVNIVNILTPFLGKVMAESSLKVNCKNLNIEPEQITPEHILGLCQNLVRGLKVFLGQEKAEQVIGSINKLK